VPATGGGRIQKNLLHEKLRGQLMMVGKCEKLRGKEMDSFFLGRKRSKFRAKKSSRVSGVSGCPESLGGSLKGLNQKFFSSYRSSKNPYRGHVGISPVRRGWKVRTVMM